ncbi:cytochrome c [Chitinophaga sp. G-6-1-13]|uniref:Cytochrome c n=1 Tax=Chitinophaga fulva TaxID=2728842 RepID=A0A848GSW6_9BACT|nr:cytochrome c [Chitinophaga fulva]NML41137.1 cytochrome c [Chitinophaga fulva]
MKQVSLLATVAATALLLYSCGSTPQQADTEKPATDNSMAATTPADPAPATAADAAKGKGKFTTVALTDPLDQKMIASGKTTYEVKCAACHKLSGEKLVGPGWKGVTERRKPEWIMNFITNTDEMIDKDPAAQAMLEECMVRMPNQHLTDDEARHLLEYMRANDGKK